MSVLILLIDESYPEISRYSEKLNKLSSVPGLANTTSVSLATLASRKPKINFMEAKPPNLNSGKIDI